MSEEETAKGKLEAYTATRGLRGERVILPEADDLVSRLAGVILNAASQRVADAGVFHLALSGGRTPEALFRMLMVDPLYRALPWDKTHIWLVDDRCVPHTDDRSNAKLIREYIVDQVAMDAEQFHPMPVLDDQGDAAYERDLREQLNEPHVGGRLDFVLLGMGADGHTASLFPHTPALIEQERWIVFNDGDTVAQPRPRMTMTYPLINAARQIVVLVSGEGKHATLQHVSLATDDIQRLPVTGIEPTFKDGLLAWYLDHPAALGPAAPADTDQLIG
jgi:6-phosphogluconolactonase